MVPLEGITRRQPLHTAYVRLICATVNISLVKGTWTVDIGAPFVAYIVPNIVLNKEAMYIN